MAVEQDEAQRGMWTAVSRILLFLLCLVSIALFVLWRIDNPRVERMRMSLVDAVAPSMEWTGEPMRLAHHMITDFENFTRVYRQNEELRKEIERLRAWREAAQQLEQENARLRALNKVRLAPEIGLVSGEIIADAGGPFLEAALVNVGARDQVADGAAVMDGAGLVGRVVGVGRKTARILFVTDYSSRVPVVIRPSGQRAIMVGDASQAPQIKFIANVEEVRPGDRVETTGDGGVFPPDLLVGALILGRDQRPRIRLAADFRKLKFVRVLRYRLEADVEGPTELIGPTAPLADPPVDPIAGPSAQTPAEPAPVAGAALEDG